MGNSTCYINYFLLFQYSRNQGIRPGLLGIDQPSTEDGRSGEEGVN